MKSGRLRKQSHLLLIHETPAYSSGFLSSSSDECENSGPPSRPLISACFTHLVMGKIIPGCCLSQSAAPRACEHAGRMTTNKRVVPSSVFFKNHHFIYCPMRKLPIWLWRRRLVFFPALITLLLPQTISLLVFCLFVSTGVWEYFIKRETVRRLLTSQCWPGPSPLSTDVL